MKGAQGQMVSKQWIKWVLWGWTQAKINKKYTCHQEISWTINMEKKPKYLQISNWYWQSSKPLKVFSFIHYQTISTNTPVEIYQTHPHLIKHRAGGGGWYMYVFPHQLQLWGCQWAETAHILITPTSVMCHICRLTLLAGTLTNNADVRNLHNSPKTGPQSQLRNL